MDDSELKKARFYALKSTNLKPCSIEELKEKLSKKGFADAVITEVLSEFTKKGLLDDSKFSRLWVENRMYSNPKGEPVLRQELKAKGVEEQVIDNTIQAIKKTYNEYDMVKNLADARMVSLKGLDKTTAKRRLFGYLKRRGFDFEIIMKVVKEEFKSLKS